MVPNKKVLSQSKQLQVISKLDPGTIKHGSPMGLKKESQSKQWEQQSTFDIGVIPKWIQHVRFTPNGSEKRAPGHPPRTPPPDVGGGTVREGASL